MLRNITRAGFIALALFAMTLMGLALHHDPPATHPTPLFQGANIDQSTLALFQRSCQNCHSENTHWPWYSRIPPASWMIAKDVHEARAHVDFSHWNSYSAAQQESLVTRIGAVVRIGRMPLSRYTVLHRDAILTPTERQQVYEWSRAEKKRLRSAGAGSAESSPGKRGETRNDEQ
jgi:hypothetical protein